MRLRGPQGSATRHWWAQRVSAVSLIPLSLWFFVSLLALPRLSYSVVKSWIAGPFNGFLAVLLVAVLTYHSYLGICEVIEDYVAGAATKKLSLLVLRIAHVLVGGAGIVSILRIIFGS